MKRIYASLGVAAIGVVSIQGVQGQSTEPGRPWSVSSSLRGFYDDNVNTTHSDKTDSFGFEVSPSVSLFLPLEQSTVAASYTYAYKYYDKEINNRDGHDDNTHTFAASLRHNFTERLEMSVRDSFVVGQEPDLLRVGNSADASYQRLSGDNIRNYGAITFNAQVTRPLGVEVGYANALYNYDDDTAGGAGPRLDRLEHAAHIEGHWLIKPDLVGILGYQFSLVDYTGDKSITFPPSTLMSDDRNNRSHYVYAGLEHNFLPNLVGSIRAGARFNDYYNSPSDESDASPYVQTSLTYEYAPECRLEVGSSHDRRSTDQFSVDASGDITRDADTTLGYISLVHRLLPKLYGSVIGNIQYSTFNGGAYDGDNETYYGAGVNLRYEFNRHLSAEVGYNYDKLDSDSGVTADGDYNRNRVYIGAVFAY